MSDPIKTINDIIKEIAETELENQQTSNTQIEEGNANVKLRRTKHRWRSAQSGRSCKPVAYHHPVEYKTGIQTVHGETDAIEVAIVNLDTNQEYENILFFNVALKNALKNKVGQKVLARIGQGTAKPGKSAPWILVDATGNPADLAKANAYIGNAGAKPAAAPVEAKQVVDAGQITPEVAALLAQLGAKPV